MTLGACGAWAVAIAENWTANSAADQNDTLGIVGGSLTNMIVSEGGSGKDPFG
jgi:hypothetical protein